MADALPLVSENNLDEKLGTQLLGLGLFSRFNLEESKLTIPQDLQMKVFQRGFYLIYFHCELLMEWAFIRI